MEVIATHKSKKPSKSNSPKDQQIKIAIGMAEKIIHALNKQLDVIKIFESTLDYAELGGLYAIFQKKHHEFLLENIQVLNLIREEAFKGLALLLKPQAGGRKISLQKHELARRLAKKNLLENGKHFSGQQLCDAVNRELFNQDPKSYADEVEKKYKGKKYKQSSIDEARQALNFSAVTWREIKTHPRPYSLRSANSFLKSFKAEKSSQ